DNFDNMVLRIKIQSNNLLQVFSGLKAGVSNILRETFGGTVWNNVFSVLDSTANYIGAFTDKIIGFFRKAWDAIVGNSYWPEIWWEGYRAIAEEGTRGEVIFVLGLVESFIDKIVSLFSKAKDLIGVAWEKVTSVINIDFSGILGDAQGLVK